MDASGDPPSGGKAPRRPACDNCKERKTRCDRSTPCSYCKASGLDCRLTKTNSTERRQRILISAKYDEAIESINHQLGQVLGMIQSLDLNKNQRNSSSPDSYDASYSLPHGSSDDASQCPPSLSYGFQGEPSFMAHLGSIFDTLGAIASNPAVEGRLGESGSQRITRQLHEAVLSHSPSTSGDSLPLPLHAQHPELKSCQLPAPEMILKIVRFAQIKRQRFFADAAVIDEHEFYELCQQVCFPISLYSFSAWIVVNVGLYGAISLLVTFSLKRGHTARGWRLNCTAARACLDLGMHRLPPGSHDPDTARKRKIFWSIYFAHAAMACTFGRPSSMPLHEITTDRLARPYDLPGMPGKIYSTGFDYSILMAEVHLQLFSAPAKDMPKHVRIKLARKFAGRVAEIHSDLLRIMQSDDGDDSFPEAATLFDILLDSLATIVWQLIPPDDPSSCLGQYHPSCVEAARRMLSSIQRFGTILNSVSFRGWSNFVNMFVTPQNTCSSTSSRLIFLPLQTPVLYALHGLPRPHYKLDHNALNVRSRAPVVCPEPPGVGSRRLAVHQHYLQSLPQSVSNSRVISIGSLPTGPDI
ncbi:hypothetical protein FGADI_8106 [Fusarium gaditjirri]|uniref:Zn(2)-C6 fungal-type domain-containing protein n=1 Tax=Fusarium gaditjirri TaxID=282569 RepID=A0A8H4T3F8_9HYPO|nr:hypothetical protein FGADI_8106 [Fusarium gaditjirri]